MYLRISSEASSKCRDISLIYIVHVAESNHLCPDTRIVQTRAYFRQGLFINDGTGIFTNAKRSYGG
jgi:hypothetical protein